MRTISCLNFKGGVGKTSLSENLSYALSIQGKRVLLIDCDRQGNASTTLLAGPPPSPGATLTQVIRGESSLLEAIYPVRPGLWVVPSDSDLDTASGYLAGRRAAYYTLTRALAALASRFDYVFFDHAGAYTPVMEAALLASEEMLIPCELEAYAVAGLFTMFAKLADTLADHVISNRGVIPYAIDMRLSMTRQYLLELREQFGELMTTPIRTDALVPKAQSVQLTVIEYAERYGLVSRAAEDFRTLANLLIAEETDDLR